MLTVLHELPPGFLAAPAAELYRILRGPTLIHLPGRRAEPLFVSLLLHGNEDTGLKAIQQVLVGYGRRTLPRALSMFIGNIAAARAGVRRLDGQPDYNRVWPGGEPLGLAEQMTMARVVEEMRARRVFASIDIHNNTGLNPHYACINRLEQDFFHLATLFSRIVVYFLTPLGVQSAAFAGMCPSVTVECGKAGEGAADDHAAAFIEAVLHLDHFPEHPVNRHDIDLYRTIATVRMQDACGFVFGQGSADVVFKEDLDRFNFRELEPGACLGRVAPGCSMPLQVWDEAGREVSSSYFEVRGDRLVTRRRVTPSMLTRDERAIRQDCLCYLMERLPYDPPAAA